MNEVADILGEANQQLRLSDARLRESEAWLQESLRIGGAFAFDMDVQQDIVSFSGAGIAILGLSDADSTQTSGRAFRSRINAHDWATALKAARTLSPERPTYAINFRYFRSEGIVLWMSIRATASFDSDRRLTRIAGLAFDMTAQTHAEEAQARLAAIVESSMDMIISVAPGGEILTWNAGAERMFGYTADEAVGRSLRMLVPDDRNDLDEIVATMNDKGSIQIETVRVAKDGRRINVLISAGSVRLSDGTRGSSAIFTDITERKRSEERQVTLINELNHRVKNTLATIQSIAAHTFRNQNDDKLMQKFVARLIALSQAHNVLTRSNWQGANLAEIIAMTIAPHQTDDETRFGCQGPDVQLNPRAALAISMALHELCTNAAKYGALSNAVGRVSLTWRVLETIEGRRLELQWIERGGPRVTKPKRDGFGMSLVRATLADDLDANVRLEFEPDGLVCNVDAPLPLPYESVLAIMPQQRGAMS